MRSRSKRESPGMYQVEIQISAIVEVCSIQYWKPLQNLAHQWRGGGGGGFLGQTEERESQVIKVTTLNTKNYPATSPSLYC